MLKKFFVALILLLVVVVAWVGITIYLKQSSVDVDPNAITYTKQMKNSFDAEELNLVTDKTEQSFSVSPSEFLNLTDNAD